MPADPIFNEFHGHGYETSSGPLVIVDVHEDDIWPVGDNVNSGADKDAIGDGLHPVVAVGRTRTADDGRPMNITGVVISFIAGLTTRSGRVSLNIADGYIVSNYVDNTLTYSNNVPNTFESAPIIGQPVFVDDSGDLGLGCTLSLSPLNEDGVANPMAGVLWYDQDQYVDAGQGGPILDANIVWPLSWSESQAEYAVCILLANGWRELA